MGVHVVPKTLKKNFSEDFPNIMASNASLESIVNNSKNKKHVLKQFKPTTLHKDFLKNTKDRKERLDNLEKT